MLMYDRYPVVMMRRRSEGRMMAKGSKIGTFGRDGVCFAKAQGHPAFVLGMLSCIGPVFEKSIRASKRGVLQQSLCVQLEE